MGKANKPNNRLRHERKKRAWSQADVAKEIGTDAYCIGRWERGEVVPGPFYRQELCKLFGKKPEELFDDVLDNDDTKVGNPFTYGNPISDPKRFFGREYEVEQIFSRLCNAGFESSSVVGERRIGKTSLLKYLAHPVVCQRYGLDPNKYLFIYEDLQRIDENTTPVRLWQRLLQQLANRCSDPQLKQMLEKIYHKQFFDNFMIEDAFNAIDAKDQYVVLLLDEFERVTNSPKFDDAFFYGLRSLAIHQHLSLVTSSRRQLIELCHSPEISSSPFFNIFANIHLELFTKDEALNFISQSLDGTGINFTEDEINTIFRIAGYHPYFLQVACSLLFSAYPKNLKQEERLIALYKGFRREIVGHLAFYWRNSDDHEKIVLMALTLLEGQRRGDGSYFNIHQLQDLYVHADRTLAHLEQRGLVVCEKDAFSLFNQSLGEWIWNEITDTRHNRRKWFVVNKGVDHLKNFPKTAKQDWDKIGPKIKDEYRDLMLRWLAEPRVLAVVGGLIKDLLTSGWRAPV